MTKNAVSEILDSKEVQERLQKSSLLFPISKVLLDKYKPSYDLIDTFEQSLEHIEDIVSKQSVLDEILHTKIDGVVIKFKYWVNNIRIFGPNTKEHIAHSMKFCNVRTPGEALLERKTYACLILGDANYSFSVIDVKANTQSQTQEIKFQDAYSVNIPLPIGSKFDSLKDYDPLTLIRSAEEISGLDGYFIISGFVKYLNCILKKPFNQPIVIHNEYDNQKARCEVLYSAGLDYENSYYILPSMIKPKQAHMGRGISQIPIVDFIFSLQMNDGTMNKEQIVGRKKTLINAVPMKYMFWAFGCKSDKEMISYICPDMNDFGLIHTIRQACLEGEKHISAIKGIIDYDIQDGFIHFSKELDMVTARYIIGSIMLSENYKKHARERCRDNLAMYKIEIVRQANRLLLHKFMPGVNRLNSDMSLYDIPEEELTEEQRIKLDAQEAARNKAICFELGDIIRKLYLIGNDIEPSMDKISLLNRRVRAGQQIEYEYKSFNNARTREIKVEVEAFIKEIKTHAQLKNIRADLDSKILALVKKTNNNQSKSLLNSFKGVATKDKSKIATQLLTLKNQSFCDSMIREIVIGSEQASAAGGVQWEHRVVHPSHLWFIDPVYTPEGGHQVGRNQQPTMYTFLTRGSLGQDVYEFIHKSKHYLPTTDSISDKYMIKLNGSIIGYINEYEAVNELYRDLMDARSKNIISRQCSVAMKHSQGVLDIWCDEGRMMNHFLNIKKCFVSEYNKSKECYDVKPIKEFEDWLKRCQESETSKEVYEEGIFNGFLELIDPVMAVYNTCIAPTITAYFDEPWKYSHIALPLQLLGYVTSINPSTPMNAGVRASYSSNHMKQAIGPIIRYPQCKYIGEMNVLLGPQIPLARTCNYDMLGYNHKPTGNNAIVAFLMYSDNQEDSFIMNRASVENGLLVIDSLFTMTAKIETNNESFKIPDEMTPKNGNPNSYLKLNPDTCLPKQVGDKFYTNDATIAKIVQLNNNDVRKSDRSTINQHHDACHPREANTRELRYVNRDVRIDENKDFKMAVFAQRRVGIPGDKFNSTNAQKGTIGRIYDPDKMPYTASGIKPDIIFNPPSVFKRNTCGQIYEPSVAKLAALLGCPMDSTPYATLRECEEIDEIYEKLGINKYGYEDLYDPESGRKMGEVFIGVMQYQRQQHLVENKLNVRAGVGDVDRMSGLSVKGRKREGGQAVDRMSNDSINSSGAVRLLRDIHLEQGAKQTIAVCDHCHKQFTYFSKDHQCWFCSSCGRHQDFTIKEVPQIQPVINQVLTGLHIAMEYRREDHKNDIIKDADETLA